MNTAVFVFISVVVICIFVKQNNKLKKEKAISSNLRYELNKARREIKLMEEQVNEAILNAQKAKHYMQAAQADYDKLLCDYHTLEQETEQYYDSKKEK